VDVQGQYCQQLRGGVLVRCRQLALHVAEKQPITGVVWSFPLALSCTTLPRKSSAAITTGACLPCLRYTTNMHKLSRTSLAAVVCPSAPFLVPRLLRATIPIAVQKIQSAPSTSLQKSCYATQAKGKKPEHKFPTRSEKQSRARAAHDEVCLTPQTCALANPRRFPLQSTSCARRAKCAI
jgi:hypothetical protein